MKKVENQSTKFKYIKLGSGGKWAEHCIQNNRIRVGFDAGKKYVFEKCINDDWAGIERYWKDLGIGTAKQHTNQMRQFFEADERIIWITFYNNKLYYCRTGEPNTFQRLRDEFGSDTCERPTCNNGWRCTNINGKVLNVTELSSSLTKTSAFRQTICNFSPDVEKYIDRLINCREDELSLAYSDQKSALLKTITNAITRLHWKDFEILSDLIFTRNGLKRVGAIGGPQKFFDLCYVEPMTGNQYFVQVKIKCSKKQILEYKSKSRDYASQNSKFIFVTGSRLDNPIPNDCYFDLWSGEQVAERVYNTGLQEWILSRAM